MKFKIPSLFGKKKKFSMRFMFFLSIPILLACFFTYIGNIYYTNHYKQMSLSVCSNEFNRFLQTTENMMSDIIGNISTLISISDTKFVTSETASPESLDASVITSVQSTLLNLSSQMPDLDNIIIVNRNGDFVLSSSGVSSISNYFENEYIYDDYPAEYWYNYQSTSRNYEFLSASVSHQSSFTEGTPVVPVVFPVINSGRGAIIVCNINSSLVYDSFLSYRFTDNSELYMINSETNEALSNTYENSTIDLTAIDEFSSSNYYTIGNLTMDGEKFYVVSSVKRSSIFGYSYVVKIPYSDIQNQTHNVFSKILLLGMLLFLILLLYMYFGSKKLSKPWLSIASRLELESNEAPSSGDIIHDIDTAIANLIDKNTGLEHNLAISLPHSQQKYLADILNNPSSISDEDMNKLIFKHEYFISVAINLSLKQTFPATSIIMNEHLYSEVYKALESVFAANFLTFSLVGTNNTLYLILNVESPEKANELNSVSDQVKALLSADTEYIDIFIGIGNVYKGIDGLRLSHQEAISNIYKDMNEDKIQIFDNTNLTNYSFGVYNENILVNHMLTGHGDAAIEFVKNIFTSCEKKPAEARSQIYTDLLKALYKAIKIKKIRVPDLQSKTEYEIIDELILCSGDEILNYFIDLINNVITIENAVGKASAAVIVKYIEENYNDELYLDSLAEKFNTTPKYLSKMLKQHLGIPFKTYLTQLRISKAEEMLLDKSLKINDISRNVGFLNQSSFIRAFKLKNGISPSEYRSLHTKK